MYRVKSALAQIERRKSSTKKWGTDDYHAAYGSRMRMCIRNEGVDNVRRQVDSNPQSLALCTDADPFGHGKFDVIHTVWSSGLTKCSGEISLAYMIACGIVICLYCWFFLSVYFVCLRICPFSTRTALFLPGQLGRVFKALAC